MNNPECIQGLLFLRFVIHKMCSWKSNQMEEAVSLRLQIPEESHALSGQIILSYLAVSSVLITTKRSLTFYFSQTSVLVLLDLIKAHTKWMEMEPEHAQSKFFYKSEHELSKTLCRICSLLPVEKCRQAEALQRWIAKRRYRELLQLLANQTGICFRWYFIILFVQLFKALLNSTRLK